MMDCPTHTIAAWVDTALGFDRLLPDGMWPVSTNDLEQEIARFEQEHKTTVRVVSEPVRRGPLILSATDPETGEPFEFLRWQLYTYVEVE